MNRHTRIAENFTVSEQITPDHVAEIASAGYRIVVCNRPDDEEPGQPSAAEIAAACETHGLDFHHLPVSGPMLPPEILERFREVLSSDNGPVFAYCRSGQRCVFLYQNALSE